MKLDLDWMEKVVAFKSLVDEEYLSTIIDHVKPTYFGDKNLSFIFDVICDFYDRRKTLPTPTEIKLYLSTQEQRDTFRKVVTELSAIEKNLNKDELYANTERFIKERGIYHAMMSVAKDVGNGEIDTGKILDMFEETCNVSLIHDIGTDLFNEMHKVREDVLQKSPTISTGYKWLDDKMGGGFMQNGRAMYVFAGETNIGKSIILGNFTVNAARHGKTVLVITLEMSEAMYSKRLVASISQTSFANMAGDIDIVEAKVEGFKNITGGRIIIKEFPPSCMTPRDIQAFIKKLKKNGINIDLIVLDYINLLTSTKGKDSYERVKFIAEETRAITYEFKCPLVTVTQLNRTGYSVEPSITALSESYALGATADFIGSLWQGDGDNEMGIMRHSLLKNRFGRNAGTTALKIDYSTLTITEDAAINSMTQESQDSSDLLSRFAR